MKRFLLGTLAIAVITLTLRAEPPKVRVDESPMKLAPLMRMKLDKSKAILEGLAMEDFDKIATNARSLHLLSTESGWNVIQTAEYASQSRDFQRATDLIADAADNKDIHRAAMGYVALTVRCVECHSYMRKHQIELMKLEAQ
jgi:hypothetical protein